MLSINQNPAYRNLSFKKVKIDSANFNKYDPKSQFVQNSIRAVEEKLNQKSEESHIDLELKLFYELVYDDFETLEFQRKLKIMGYTGNVGEIQRCGKDEYGDPQFYRKPSGINTVELKYCTPENIEKAAESVITDCKSHKIAPSYINYQLNYECKIGCSI